MADNGLYLGTSSTVSFTIRAAATVSKHMQSESLGPRYELSLDGDASQIQWSRVGASEEPDLGNLPSIDHAIHLARTVSFRIGNTLKIFDEEDFVRQIDRFYNSARDEAPLSRLRYCQYLLDLAFGEGFSVVGAGRTSTILEDSRYFSRAVEILPEVYMLYKGPMLTADVLTLVALYLACLDMRQTAYSYVSITFTTCYR